ncbi:MAG: sigma-70 family RNA polymerase sigma factor [Bacteroidales bacterium]|nr:sigma-70 family RNA polymerase sigma factor [Bacteroidales bacterium]
MSDEEIIKAVLAGDKEKYAEIVVRYQNIVVNLCYKICGSRLDVEEVAQQVFVELYSALPRFRFQSKLSTFIYRITVNVVSKYLARSNRLVPQAENAPEMVSDSRNVEQNIIHDERMQQLYNAISQLKYEQRTALVLCTFDDFSYQDVADVMQCSLTKVEALIFRAKKNLRKILTEA